MQIFTRFVFFAAFVYHVRSPLCVLRSLKLQQKDENIKNQQGIFPYK